MSGSTVVDQPASPMTAPSPRSLTVTSSRGDIVFRRLALAAGCLTLLITGFITLYLIVDSFPALREMGLSFLTEKSWSPENEVPKFGVAAMLYGTFVVGAVAMAVATPTSLATAVFINEYAPPRVRGILTSIVDLLAAIPSVVFGLWAVAVLLPALDGPQVWLTRHLDFVRLFEAQSVGRSLFETGLVVSIMVIPITASVMREVLAQAPRVECDGALALGGTRWGMIRTVVLPFGRGGLIGASMLGLGRALGETVAASLVLAVSYDTDGRILESGGVTITSIIATQFGESSQDGVRALLAAGLVLFIVTLVINLLAAIIVNRSRSASGMEI